MAIIRMLTPKHGGSLGLLLTGQQYDLPDALAAELVGARDAAYVGAGVIPAGDRIRERYNYVTPYSSRPLVNVSPGAKAWFTDIDQEGVWRIGATDWELLGTQRFAPGYVFCAAGYSPVSSASLQGPPADTAGNDGLVLHTALTPAVAFATRGYVTAGLAANQYAYNEATAGSSALFATPLFFSCVLNAQAPAATQTLFGTCDATTGHGFFVSVNAAGNLQISVRSTSGTTNFGFPLSVYCDPTTPVDRTFGFAYDPYTKTWYQFADGVLIFRFRNQPAGDFTPTSVLPFGFGVAGADLAGSKTPAVAARGRGFHLFNLPDIPLNIGDLMLSMHRNPETPIRASQPIYPTRRLLLANVGQSNSIGYGSTNEQSNAFGAPLTDPIGPTGGGGAYGVGVNRASMWPRCSGELAKRGVYAHTLNLGVGSTSLSAGWVGCLFTWVSNMRVIRGTYVISSGGVWRCGGLAGFPHSKSLNNELASTTQPVGTANIDGSAGDLIAWDYLGPVTGADGPGLVYSFGNARFDPNGYIAEVVSVLASIPAPATWQRVVNVMFGESEQTQTTITQAVYTAALISLANRFTSLGYLVLLGSSQEPNVLTGNGRYATVLLPALQAALTALAGNPLVKPGANLAQGVFSPNQQPVTTTHDVTGLIDSGVHMNDAMLRRAAVAQATAIMAAI